MHPVFAAMQIKLQRKTNFRDSSWLFFSTAVNLVNFAFAVLLGESF